MKRRILVIEDDPHVREVLRALLVRRGYDVSTATDGRDGTSQFESEHFDLVITDMLMPEVDGIEMLGLIKTRKPHLPVIAMSAGHQIAPDYYLKIATGLGAARALRKPFAAEQLFACVEGLLPGNS